MFRGRSIRLQWMRLASSGMRFSVAKSARLALNVAWANETFGETLASLETYAGGLSAARIGNNNAFARGPLRGQSLKRN
jgi:hypothetical protein